ncbi:hypothetical protein TNCV_778041 [Trichonephila clavipes]|nr:hypothetical protein TNCV_778041 [Trichonephila clavipes]
MVFDEHREEDHSPCRLLSRNNQWWLEPRQRVSSAEPCSFQSEIVGSAREAPPKGFKEAYRKDRGDQ